jgi:nitroreductase
MDIFEAIDKRHSYRSGFKDLPVSREDLERIVHAGIQAPSGCNAQTTSFVIVDEPALIEKLSAIMSDRPVFAQAKAVIVCVVAHEAVYHGMSFGPEDCAAAVQNMLLAISALGYATVWTDGALRNENRAEKIAALLGVPEDKQVRVILPVGVPTEVVMPKEKKPFDERAYFNSFGQS